MAPEKWNLRVEGHRGTKPVIEDGHSRFRGELLLPKDLPHGQIFYVRFERGSLKLVIDDDRELIPKETVKNSRFNFPGFTFSLSKVFLLSSCKVGSLEFKFQIQIKEVLPISQDSPPASRKVFQEMLKKIWQQLTLFNCNLFYKLGDQNENEMD